MKIKGKQINLRKLRKADASSFSLNAKDKEISLFTKVPHPYLLQNALDFIKLTHQEMRKKTAIKLGIEHKGSKTIVDNVNYFDEPIDSLATRIGTSGLANESVVFALFAFLKEPFDFDKLMLSCVRNGGDTDSIASIAGNFYGALNGFSAIPKKYIINLQDSQKLQSLVDEFAEVMVSEHDL